MGSLRGIRSPEGTLRQQSLPWRDPAGAGLARGISETVVAEWDPSGERASALVDLDRVDGDGGARRVGAAAAGAGGGGGDAVEHIEAVG